MDTQILHDVKQVCARKPKTKPRETLIDAVAALVIAADECVRAIEARQRLERPE